MKITHVFSALLLCVCGVAQSQQAWQASTVKVMSPVSGEIEVYKVTRPDAKITLMMLLGGPWRVDPADPQTGMPKGVNFLLAIIPKVIDEHPVNVVVMKKPEAAGDIWNAPSRVTDKHQGDLKAVFIEAEKLGKPVWLAGTSLGSISAMNLYFSDVESRVAGIALSSSSARDKDGRKPGVLTYPLENVKVPVYLVGHEKDECYSSAAETLAMMSMRFKASPNLKVQVETAGHSANGNTCGPTHWHGFVNATDEVAKRMVEWMISATAN